MTTNAATAEHPKLRMSRRVVAAAAILLAGYLLATFVSASFSAYYQDQTNAFAEKTGYHADTATLYTQILPLHTGESVSVPLTRLPAGSGNTTTSVATCTITKTTTRTYLVEGCQ